MIFTNYIGYSQVETLLKALPTLKTLLTNLQIDLKNYEVMSKTKPDAITEEEIIQALSYGNHVLSDIPKPFPVPGDKMTNILTEKDEIMHEIAGEKDDLFYLKRQLINDIHTIGEVVDKMNVALKNLTPNQQYILEWFYKEGTSRKSWKDIACELKENEILLRDDRRAAIENMVKTLRITVDTFEFAMENIGRE